jgi:hypothetical protein
MAQAWGFVPGSGDQATGQVDGPMQTQSLGNLSQALAAGRKEAAEQPAAAQLFHPGLPGLGRGADSVEDRGDFLVIDTRLPATSVAQVPQSCDAR